MGRKKLDIDTDIKYQTIRINSRKFPYLIDFLRDNENTNSLICTLIQSSRPFINYAERRKNGERVSIDSLNGYYVEDESFTHVIGGFND
ncbi:MAG: hypothetical protein Q7T77_07095 [Sulfuricurvum sp.]|nr:hypothetical protein [Sulfuricurvum sp.]